MAETLIRCRQVKTNIICFMPSTPVVSSTKSYHNTVTRHCSMWSRPFILFILLPIYRAKLPNPERIVLVPECYV